MKTEVGPEAWISAGIRGLHPVRLLLCLVGASLSVWSLELAGKMLVPAIDESGLEQFPLGQVADALGGYSLPGGVARGGLLLWANLMWWSLLGAWVSRHELLAQRASFDREQPGALPDRTQQLCPTGLVKGWWPQVWLSFVLVLAVAGLILVPAMIAWEALARLGGVGAVLVAALLPVLLVASLVLLFVGVVPAWAMMPVVLAAECSDCFDAIARSYAYFWGAFSHTGVRLLTVISAFAVPAVPAVLASVFGPEQSADWSPEARLAGLLATLAVTASLFWSLQAVLYLAQRATVDDTDVHTLADAAPPPMPKPTEPDGSAETAGGVGNAECPGGPNSDKSPLQAEGSTKTAGSQRSNKPVTPFTIAWLLQYLVMAVATWLLTYLLLSWGGVRHAEWLAWGLGESFVPSVYGELEQTASWVAAGWGVLLFLALPVLKLLRS